MDGTEGQASVRAAELPGRFRGAIVHDDGGAIA
jgi:hypothetical protein